MGRIFDAIGREATEREAGEIALRLSLAAMRSASNSAIAVAVCYVSDAARRSTPRSLANLRVAHDNMSAMITHGDEDRSPIVAAARTVRAACRVLMSGCAEERAANLEIAAATAEKLIGGIALDEELALEPRND